MSEADRTGIVVGAHGRHCVVETPNGARVQCHPKGKKNQAVVGDRVIWQPSGDEGAIEKVQTRRNLLYRQDEARTKSFAANLDQILVLLAADPEFSENQLTRALIASRDAGIPALVVLNKRDLQPAFDRAWERLGPYRSMGETVLPLCLKSEDGTVDELRQRLLGKTTLVLGPSGAGKSTLINRLIPLAKATTGEVSKALNSGKHTTTTSTWYWLDASRQTALIDSPGFQEFGLQHIDAFQLAHLMPDLEAELGNCRFYNCTHLHEPGCAVQQAVGERVSVQRYRLYKELFLELSTPTRY